MSKLFETAKAKGGLPALPRAGDANIDPADQRAFDRALTIQRIRLADIAYNPRNIRDEDDLPDDPEVKEVAASLREMGQMQAAVVVTRDLYLERYPEYKKEISQPYVVMIGNVRKCALGLNGESHMDCIVKESGDIDPDKLELMPVHENLHRKDPDPLAFAYWCQDQKARLGSEREVAKVAGKTQPWVNQLLQLMKLLPELQRLVQTREITATLGRTLAKLDKAEQQRIVDEVSQLDAEERREYWVKAQWRQEVPARSVRPSKPRSAARPVSSWVFRVQERSPISLAGEIRKELSDEEIEELVTELRKPEPAE
jgi:ParB-like chromosome segregation protein Spo0J